MARSTTVKKQASDPVATLAEQVAALTAMVAALTANASNGSSPAPKVSKVKATPKGKSTKGSKVYTWKPWACAKFGIPSIVGATFAYNGKNGTTDHVVTAVSPDGIVSSIRA